MWALDALAGRGEDTILEDGRKLSRWAMFCGRRAAARVDPCTVVERDRDAGGRSWMRGKHLLAEIHEAPVRHGLRILE